MSRKDDFGLREIKFLKNFDDCVLNVNILKENKEIELYTFNFHFDRLDKLRADSILEKEKIVQELWEMN